MNKMNKYLNYLAACLLALAALSSCNDNNEPDEQNPVLTPFAEHILGRWLMLERAYMEQGEWVAADLDGDREIVTFRPDGTMLGVYATSKNRTNLTLLDWSDVNEGDCTFTSAGFRYRLLRLTEDEKEVVTVETPEGRRPYKEIYRRIDNEPLTDAERVVGRWTLARRYEWVNDRVDDHWVEVTEGLPAEHWCEYTEAGTYTTYTRLPGGEEQQSEATRWMLYEDEGVVVYGDWVDPSYFQISLEADYTRMVMYHSVGYDPKLDFDEQANTVYMDILTRNK